MKKNNNTLVWILIIAAVIVVVWWTIQPGPFRRIRPVESMKYRDEVGDDSDKICCNLGNISPNWIRSAECYELGGYKVSPRKCPMPPGGDESSDKICCRVGAGPSSLKTVKKCDDLGGNIVPPRNCISPREVCCQIGGVTRPPTRVSAKYCSDHNGRVFPDFHCGIPPSPPPIHSEEDGCPGGVCCKSGGLPPVCTQSVKKCHNFSGHVVDDSLCSPFEDSYSEEDESSSKVCCEGDVIGPPHWVRNAKACTSNFGSILDDSVCSDEVCCKVGILAPSPAKNAKVCRKIYGGHVVDKSLCPF